MLDRYFRFFINVDQCLNIDSFAPFFYPLQSANELYLGSASLEPSGQDPSLAEAAEGIRSHWSRYPFRMRKYHMIFAMRSAWRKEPAWKDTVLYRLLRLRYELIRNGIFLRSREMGDKALSLVILYDSDFDVRSAVLSDYWRERCVADFRLFARLSGLTEDGASWPDEERWNPEDFAERDLIRAYRAAFPAAAADREDGSGDGEARALTRFTDFLRSELSGFQIFEKLVDRNERRQSLLTQLQVVRYATFREEGSGFRSSGEPQSMESYCAEVWDYLFRESQKDLRARFGRILSRYELRLARLERRLEPELPSRGAGGGEPERMEIVPLFPASEETGGEDAERTDLQELLRDFESRRFHAEQALPAWEDVCRRFRERIRRLDQGLKEYAKEHSILFHRSVAQRRESPAPMSFPADRETAAREIGRLRQERENWLDRMKGFHVNPSLTFQDELNMEASLDEADQKISFYLRCIRAMHRGRFLLLVLLFAALSLGLYLYSQSYVLRSWAMLPAALVYLGAAFLLMLCTWNRPRAYFQKQIRGCIRALEEEMERFFLGYRQRQEQFRDYLTACDALDQVDLRLKALEKAEEQRTAEDNMLKWHKVRLSRLRRDLSLFRDLIDCYREENGPDGEEAGSGEWPEQPVQPGSYLVDNPLYWPPGWEE